jgi:L-rhamnose mutarotase
MKKTTLPLIVLGITLSACQVLPEVKPVFGPANPPAEVTAKANVKYCASLVELRPEKEYRELHANVWPEVRAAIAKANIRNYHIYTAGIARKRVLVSHFEYTGTNPKVDIARIANDPTTKNKWWPLTDACQVRLPGTPEGNQWLGMEQVMHIE